MFDFKISENLIFIDPENASSLFCNKNIVSATVIPRRENLNVINVTQFEKDAILVCYDSEYYFNWILKVSYRMRWYVIKLNIFVFTDVVKMVTLQGKPRISKKQLSELQFNFQIESISKYNIFYPFVIYYSLRK